MVRNRPFGRSKDTSLTAWMPSIDHADIPDRNGRGKVARQPSAAATLTAVLHLIALP